MKDVEKEHDPHPLVEPLLQQYARDLAQVAPSSYLDARIDVLVAGGTQKSTRRPATVRHAPHHPWKYAAAAGFAALAVGAGIFIGMKIEHSRERQAANQAAARDAAWPPANLTMWPTDSVSFKIPAEYSPQGTLVAVDPQSKNTSARYWIDVVVSNDGTFRVERIVPIDPKQMKGGRDDVAPQVQ